MTMLLQPRDNLSKSPIFVLPNSGLVIRSRRAFDYDILALCDFEAHGILCG